MPTELKFQFKEEKVSDQSILTYFYNNPTNFINFEIEGLSTGNSYSYKVYAL